MSLKQILVTSFQKKPWEIASIRFPNTNYIYKNLNETPDEQFDFIFCTEVLEHILHPHIPFKNLLKMMKEKSGLLITVPNGREDTYAGHINFWSPESWNAFISQNVENHKFETGEIKPFGLYALIKN
ncbi:MAG: class I SAM-dependent methyltransferase [Chloroflexia bacterium]|nr:class I SAM-dependent methyltransferase [Chloroflexia bacterium]